MTPEEKTRGNIDAMLTESGWAVLDYKAYSPYASRGIALREVPLGSGTCDWSCRFALASKLARR